MSDKFFPKISVNRSIMDNKLDFGLNSARISPINSDNKVSKFSDVMKNMVKSLDETAKAPDQVLQDALVGNGADIHDVMIAISKAEVGVNIATQVTTKVVQAYEKIISIQV